MSLVTLDDGILAWLAEDPGDGRPNAGLVVDADAATAIDTLCVPSQTAAFVAAVDELGLRVRRTVLTASTIEFVGGSALFTMSGMYGRRQTSVHLDQPPTPDVYRRILPAVASEFDDTDVPAEEPGAETPPPRDGPAAAATPRSGGAP